MHCPFCPCEETKVIDSRLVNNQLEVRRRRQCAECKERFTTFERQEKRFPIVRKKNGEIQAYEEDKIHQGLDRAFQNLRISNTTIDDILERINKSALEISGEITTQQIGSLILKELKDVNVVAYVRFASVYRKFTSIDDFLRELKELEQSEKNKDGDLHIAEITGATDTTDT